MKKKVLIFLGLIGVLLTVYYSLRKSFDNLVETFGDEEDFDDLGL